MKISKIRQISIPTPPAPTTPNTAHRFLPSVIFTPQRSHALRLTIGITPLPISVRRPPERRRTPFDVRGAAWRQDFLVQKQGVELRRRSSLEEGSNCNDGAIHREQIAQYGTGAVPAELCPFSRSLN